MEYSDFENFETLKCFICGWDLMDCGMGWMDRVSILCGYIDPVYIYLYTCLKIVAKIFMGFKISFSTPNT